jgi:uncharacterized protein DUF1566
MTNENVAEPRIGALFVTVPAALGGLMTRSVLAQNLADPLGLSPSKVSKVPQEFAAHPTVVPGFRVWRNIMSRIRTPCYVAFTALVLLLHFGTAAAETENQVTPCGVAWDGYPGHGLVATQFDTIVYDSTQGLCWLANANLAGDPLVRDRVALASLNPDGSTPVINQDGTMNWETALNWVAALNAYNNGKGWLGHKNWQLPTTPHTDPTCSQFNYQDFGAQCTGSAMAHLYSVGLARTFPDSVVPQFFSFVWPFFNLQPGLYWTSTPGNGDANGVTTFSFNLGINGSNTFKYNYFHVLPMTSTVLGPILAGKGVLPYLSGPAAGKAVYDTHTGLSWTLDANLPAITNFGVAGMTSITSNDPLANGDTMTPLLIDKDGAVYFSAVDPTNSDRTSSWMTAMNANYYAGTNSWMLPSEGDLLQLFQDLDLHVGDWRLELFGQVGPFWNLQPGFYWSCQRDDGTDAQALQAPCDPGVTLPPGPHGHTILQESFNFDDGFVGTDSPDKQFYVMVYYPAPSALQ